MPPSELTPDIDLPELLYEMRGARVVLDADIAAFFGRKTGHINELRSRNDVLFPDHYAFELSEEEWAILVSQNAISSRHGGRRSRPWAYTEHGFAMLAMLAMRMSGKVAAKIGRAIIDTFIDYRRGTLPRERVLSGPAGHDMRVRLQRALFTQMEALLQIPAPTGSTVSEELQNVTEAAIGRVKAVLDRPALNNEQISAEIGKLEAETAKLYAEAQSVHADTANTWADVYLKRLNLIAKMREMASQLERDDVLDDMDALFDGPTVPALLPSQSAITKSV